MMPENPKDTAKPLSPEVRKALKALLYLSNSDREMALTYIFKFWFNNDTQILFLDEPLNMQAVELKNELLGNTSHNLGSEDNIAN